MDAVSEVLVDRSQQADRLTQMVALSLTAHLALLAAVTLSGRIWPATTAPDDAHVMTVSFAGPPGPQQGRNPETAKPIQVAVPDASKAKNDAPPALVKPDMVEPVKAAKPEPKAVTKPEPKKEEPQLHSRTPTQGAEVKQGTARVQTNAAAIPFGGLATGGGGGSAAYTDFADFCCPEYIQIMKQHIYSNWREHQGQEGLNRIKFVVHRNGVISDVTVEKSAGQFLDLASTRALEQTKQLPPLPNAFTLEKLTVHLEFEYKR